jgi:hypothetical protein
MSGRISERIRLAELSDSQVLAFCEALRELARAGAPRSQAVSLLEARLRRSVESDCLPTPLEGLWPHRELFLRACITAAVCHGDYRVESARIVGDYARELGISARQLGDLETVVLGELIDRGREDLSDDGEDC